MRKKYLLIAFACMILVQLAFPLKMIFDRELILLRGETFLMKIKPLDPYDAFRGRYVMISYEDSEVPMPKKFQHMENLKELYITVKKDEHGILVYDQVTLQPPTDTNSYIREEAESYGFSYDDDEIWLDLPYRYYMNENKAPRAERLLNEAYAQIVVYKGQVVLKGILVNGMPIEKYLDMDLSEKDY